MVNIDTNTAVAFVSEGSPIRQSLKAFVQGKQLVMTQAALGEFQQIVAMIGGPSEKARALRFVDKLMMVPDNPSPRARALKPTKSLQPNDIIILGTGDQLGIITMTADGKAVRAAHHQGVPFQVYQHPTVPLKGA